MAMAEENKQEKPIVPSEYNLNAKWDACLDLGVRRFTYFSLIGGFAGLLLFREFFFNIMVCFRCVFVLLMFVCVMLYCAIGVG